MVKIKLELVINEDGSVAFLNFWDSLKGNDVTCEVKEGKLFEQIPIENSKELGEKEISLQEFIDKVHAERKDLHE